jgi:FkbM family methyltransferase
MFSIFAEFKTKFKFLLKKIFIILGYEIRKLPKELPQELPQEKYLYHVNAYSDQKLLLQNREVKIIFDVGANVGQTIIEYQKLFSNAIIYAFEPFAETFAVLSETYSTIDSLKPYKLAITDTTTIKPFFYNKFNPTNSLLPICKESGKYVENQLTENIGSTDVKTITLDDFCQRESISKIHILKMDIQGGELMALQGAINLLSQKSIDLIYTEVLFAKLYEKQANFYDLCDFLEQYDYILYGLYNFSYGKNGVLAWGDAIFISPSIEDSFV